MRQSSQGASDPVYCIEDCLICAVIDVQAQCLQLLFLDSGCECIYVPIRNFVIMTVVDKVEGSAGNVM